MVNTPTETPKARLGASSSPRLLPALRNLRQFVEMAALAALIGPIAGCAPEEQPKEDPSAPWIIKAPRDMVPSDQICSASLLPLDGGSDSDVRAPRQAIRLRLSPEQLERNLYDRVRTTGEYELNKDKTRIRITPGDEWVYFKLLEMHPFIQIEAANRSASLADLDIEPRLTPDWLAAEKERIKINQRIEESRMLMECLGIEIEDEFFAQAVAAQEPFPEEWTDAYMLDSNHPYPFTGMDAFWSGAQLEIPALADNRYVSFDRMRFDHLSVFLELVVAPKYHDQLAQLGAFVMLTSTEGEWRVPVAYLNQSEKFGIWVRDLVLSNPPDDQLRFTYYRKITQEFGSEMLLTAQYNYHYENGYLPFTEANRDANIAELTGENGEGPLKKVAPTEEDLFVLRWIYESDPEHTEQASYTYQETLDLIKGMGSAVNNGLHNFGLPAHIKVKILVTSLGRTVEYIEALRSGVTLGDYLDPRPDNPFRNANGNAARTEFDEDGKIRKLSGHGYYNAADISNTRIMLIDTRTGTEYIVGIEENQALVHAARVSMYAYLANRGAEGIAMGKPEAHPPHVHVVGKRKETE